MNLKISTNSGYPKSNLFLVQSAESG